MLFLREPEARDEARVMDFQGEFFQEGDRLINGSGALGKYDAYAPWLRRVDSLRRAETTPPDLVPSSTLLGVREEDQALVGIIDIRHRLNAYLSQFGGHIGYSVRKSERGKGYGHEMLRLALTRVCPSLGIERALITCDKDNEASRRTILSCGGRLENEVAQEDRVTQRYWAKVRPFAVREGRTQDAMAICRLNREALGYDESPEETARWVARVLDRPQNRVWIAEMAGETIGYLHAADYETCCHAPQKNLLALAVAPARQGQGVGRALLNEAEIWAKWEGCAGVRLVSGMDRAGAHAFYLACGYRVRKEQKNFVKALS